MMYLVKKRMLYNNVAMGTLSEIQINHLLVQLIVKLVWLTLKSGCMKQHAMDPVIT